MILTVWRYSHLFLALVSSIFLLIAAITGIILSFSPINNKLSSNYQPNASSIYLDTFLDVSSKKYPEIIELKKDKNGFFQLSVINDTGDLETFYVDIRSGDKLGPIKKESMWFSFSRDIHRSLLLKKTGRIIIGIVSFFLFLIAISGCVLITKRQLSIKRFYSKVVFDDFYRFWHLMVARYSLLFVVVIALTGTYLSLERFELIPSKASKHDFDSAVLTDIPKLEWKNFTVFKATIMDNIESLQFPFSPFAEDYFTLTLGDEELLVNQFNGEIISKFNFSQISKLSSLSYSLHTGRGSILWSIILCFTCFCVLFFIYTGFNIYWNRIKTKRANKFSTQNSEILILVGTENGSTNRFAGQFYDALIGAGKSVFIDKMNNYKPMEGLSHLLIFTSTYGNGDAPSSAVRFFKKFKKNPIQSPFLFSVVGFGSSFYPEFCKYAFDVQKFLDSVSNANCSHPIHLIDNQSEQQYKNWLNSWSFKNNLLINSSIKECNDNSNFLIENCSNPSKHPENHFLLYLNPEQKELKFSSGDLLAIKPPNSTFERMYSLAKLVESNTLLLAVKKQADGICSNYLSSLKSGDILNSRIIENTKFHAPREYEKLLLISNGTGIAPFLGIISANTKNKPITLLWGGRSEASLSLYKPMVDSFLEQKRIASFQIALSNNDNYPANHVQDLLTNENHLIQSHLESDSAIMICGAKKMGEDVVKIITDFIEESSGKPIDGYIDSGTLKIDTY